MSLRPALCAGPRSGSKQGSWETMVTVAGKGTTQLVIGTMREVIARAYAGGLFLNCGPGPTEGAERVGGLQWVVVGAVPSKCFLAQRPGPRAGAHLAPGMSVTDRQVNARPLLKVRFTGIVVCCAQDFCEQAPEGAPSYSLVLRLHCFPSCAVAPDLPIAGDRGLE